MNIFGKKFISKKGICPDGQYSFTKQELKSYVALKQELLRIEQQITEYRRKIESPAVSVWGALPGGTKSKGNRNRDISDYIVKLSDLLVYYNDRWDRLIGETERVERAIAAVENPIERVLLGYKYIDGLTWEQVCVKMNYSWRQVHYIHSQALKNIQKIK